MTKRVAVYGGSFNPPHVGHAMVAAWLRWVDLVDEVWFVPTGAHAFGKDLAPFALRHALCDALAGALGPWARVEPIEAGLPAPNYTIVTLQALQQRHPRHHFRLVIGADQRESLPKWRDWAQIEADFSPIMVGRAGYESPPDVPVFPGISSTEVRARLAAGASVDGLVPAAVRVAMADAVSAAAGWPGSHTSGPR